MNLKWEFLHPNATPYHLGYIGALLTEKSPLPAAEQIDKLYKFGGWRITFTERDYNEVRPGNVLCFPGDPPQYPIARAKLRDETICVYAHDFWAIFQPDGTFEVCRLD